MTKSEKEKKDRRNKIIVGIVLVAVMMVSTLGYSLISGEKTGTSGGKTTYNGITFLNTGSGWQTSLGEKTLSFSYSPLEITQIKAPYVSINSFLNMPVYLDSDNPSANYEMARSLGLYVLTLQEACLNASDCRSADLPLKSCRDVVISIRSANVTSTSMSVNGNCTFISGGEDILKDVDAFVYKTLGVTS